jgi:hypothetical protein
MLHAKIQTVFLLALLLVATMARPRVHALERRFSNHLSPTGVAAAPAPEARTLESLGYVLGAPRAVAIQGIHAAAITEGQLAMLNVADPTHPRAISYLTLPGQLEDLALDENYAYIAWGDCWYSGNSENTCAGGLHIVDIRNPTAPALVSTFQGSKVAYAVAVEGSYAYVVTIEAVLVFDISNPAAPKQRGILPGTSGTDIKLLRDHTTSRLYALVSAFGRLHIIDVSNPTAPVEASAPLSGWDRVAHLAFFSATGSTPNKTYAYLAIYEEGLRIFDVTNPAHTTQVATFEASAPYGVIAATDRYLFAPNSHGLQILDAVDPVAPTIVGSFPVPGHFVTLAGHYALIAQAKHVAIIDIAEPTAPIEVGSYDIGKSVNQIVTTGTPGSETAYAYASWEYCDPVLAHGCEGGLRVLDISKPTAPIQVGTYTLPGAPRAIVLVGRHIYVAVALVGSHLINSLVILDLSTPTQPTQISTTTVPGFAKDLAVAGHYAYVTAWDEGLRVIDVANPAAPTEVGSYKYSPHSSTQGVAAADGYVYITDQRDNRLMVLDASNPTALRNIATVALPGGGDNVTTANGYLYVNTRYGGIAILRHGSANTGQVQDVRGMPVSGVRISANGVPATASGVTGGYRVTNLTTGTHTLTPGLQGYTFWPASRTVTAASQSSGQNFTLLPLPVSATIAPDQAATLVVTDTQGLPTKFDIPAQAVTTTTTLKVTPIPETGRTGIAFAGHAFEVAALQNGAPLPAFKFTTPMTVTIRYSAADVWTVSDKGALVLQRWNGSTWEDAGATCTPSSRYNRNVSTKTLQVAICQPGRYALFGSTKQVMLPLLRS